MCSCTIYRGLSVLCEIMFSSGHIISHLIECFWGCGVVGVPRCECVVVWGYIYYTLFTLISRHHGKNREMCGLEKGKPGSASFLGRQWHWLNFETSQFINNAPLAIRQDAIHRVLALCVVWVSVFYFLLVSVAESITCVLCLQVLHWGERLSVATWWVNGEECRNIHNIGWWQDVY